MSAAGIRKRSVIVAGHRSSVSLEEEFWVVLKRLAAARQSSLNTLITEIDSARGARNLSSALRVFVLGELERGRELQRDGVRC